MSSNKEEKIRNFLGQIIGIVETKPNGNKLIRDFPSQRILGYYIKESDITTDFLGRRLGEGDQLVSLLFK